MWKKSKQHLSDTNEAYFTHLRFAFSYGVRCVAAGVMAIVHGLVPGLFVTSASDTVKELATCTRPSQEKH